MKLMKSNYKLNQHLTICILLLSILAVFAQACSNLHSPSVIEGGEKEQVESGEKEVENWPVAVEQTAFSPTLGAIYQNWNYQLTPKKKTTRLILTNCTALEDGYFLAGYERDHSIRSNRYMDDSGDMRRQPSSTGSVSSGNLMMWHVSKKGPVSTVSKKYKKPLESLCVVGKDHILTNDISQKFTNSLLIWQILWDRSQNKHKLKLIDKLLNGEAKRFISHRTSIYNFDDKFVITGFGSAGTRDVEHPYLEIWDFEARKYIHNVRGGASPIAKIDSGHFASLISWDQPGLRIWNIKSGECIKEIKDSRGIPSSSLLCLNKQYIIGNAAFQNELFIWNFGGDDKLLRIPNHAAKFHYEKKLEYDLVMFDENSFITFNMLGEISIWDFLGNLVACVRTKGKIVSGSIIKLSNDFILCRHVDTPSIIDLYNVKIGIHAQSINTNEGKITSVLKVDDKRLIAFKQDKGRWYGHAEMIEFVGAHEKDGDLSENSISDQKRCTLS